MRMLGFGLRRRSRLGLIRSHGCLVVGVIRRKLIGHGRIVSIIGDALSDVSALGLLHREVDFGTVLEAEHHESDGGDRACDF